MTIGGDVWAALLGAVVGAVAGGGIAWLLQLDTHFRQKRKEATDRSERQQATAYSLLFKLISIASHYAIYQRHLDECYVVAAKDKDVGEPWQFVLPMGDEPDPISFSTEEMTLLVQLQMMEVFNSLLTLADAHNQIGRLTSSYRAKREALTALLPISAFSGNAAASEMDGQQINRARPLMIELNHIAEGMRSFVARDVKESADMLDAAEAAFKAKLKLPISFTPSAPPT